MLNQVPRRKREDAAAHLLTALAPGLQLAGRTPKQTPPHPPRLCLREKNNPRPSILRCQPPTHLLRGPGPARGAHTHPLRSHPDTYTNRAPSTRAHTHRGHAGTAAPLPHKGWRARGHTQPRAGTLTVPSPRRHPAAVHPHPRVPGAPWGPSLLTPKRVGMKCRPPLTPLQLGCGESAAPISPSPFEARTGLGSRPSPPAASARTPGPGAAASPSSWARRHSPVQRRSGVGPARVSCGSANPGPPPGTSPGTGAGGKRVRGGGARAASVSPPSPSPAPPPLAKKF